MKIATSLLLTFFVISQLHAQMNFATDTLAPEVNIRMIAITQAIPLDIQTKAPQSGMLVDIVALARSSAYAKDFEKADRLLSGYNEDHIDKDALSFHAQVLFWMKSFDRCIDVYEKAIRLFPEPSTLHLDYARVSYQLSRLTKTRQLLTAYRHYDSSNAEADIMTAYMELWNGKIGLAKKKANLLLQKYPANPEAKDIISKVNLYTIPYIKTGIDILSDDQPLKAKIYHVEAGVYKSRFFAPTLQGAFYQFKGIGTSYQSTWMQVANSLQPGIKNIIKLQGGLFQQNGNASAVTGSVEVSRKITHDFLLQAALERRPYQYAVASVKSIVMEGVSQVSLNYNHNNKWFGKANYGLHSYKDGNKIQNAYFWILAPFISRTHYMISAGYSFQYADAVENKFVSKRPLSEVIASPAANGIPGVFSPYFTPEKQLVHAALASVKIIPTKKLEFSSRVSIGILSKAEIPYLWLNKSGNEFNIQRGFTTADYMQVSWVNEICLAASDRIYLAANYNYDKLLYYTSNKGSLALKYLFLR